LEALGLFMSKTLVYYTVQEAARKVPGMRRERVMEGVRVPALGSDVTSVKGNCSASPHPQRLSRYPPLLTFREC